MVLALISVLLLGADGRKCTEAFSEASVANKRGELRKARAALLECASEACPAAMRPLCSEDLRQLELRIPSVVLGAQDETGQDLVDVRVSMDGQKLLSRLDGRATDVEPGPHAFRFERPGSEPVVMDVVIREGVKARPLLAQLRPVEKPGPDVVQPEVADPVVVRPVVTDPQVTSTAPSRQIGWPVWVAGAVTVVSTVTWAGAGLAGLSGRGALDACKGNCAPSAVDAVRTQFLVADIALGVALVAAAATVILYLVGN